MKAGCFKPLVLGSFLALGFWFQSCTQSAPDCPPVEDRYYSLNEYEKSKVPYTGTDTLSFITDAGDTQVYYGQGSVSTFEAAMYGGNENPDCPHGSAYNEVIRTKYKSSILNRSMLLSFLRDGIYLDILLNDVSIRVSARSINNTGSIQYPFYDSIQLGTKWYYKVNEIKDKSNILYYSEELGIIRIEAPSHFYQLL